MAELLECFEQVSKPALAPDILATLDSVLSVMHMSYPEFNYALIRHDEETVTAAEKLAILRGTTEVVELLAKKNIIGNLDVPEKPEMIRVEFAVIKTIASQTPYGQDFLMTTYGVGKASTDEKFVIMQRLAEDFIVSQYNPNDLSEEERLMILECGQEYLLNPYDLTQTPLEEASALFDIFNSESPTRKKAKAMMLGTSDPQILQDLGQDPGYVGPFCLNTDLPRFIMHRETLGAEFFEKYHKSGQPIIIADIAMSKDISLLFRFEYLAEIIKIYDGVMGLPESVLVDSEESLILRSESQTSSPTAL